MTGDADERRRALAHFSRELALVCYLRRNIRVLSKAKIVPKGCKRSIAKRERGRVARRDYLAKKVSANPARIYADDRLTSIQ